VGSVFELIDFVERFVLFPPVHRVQQGGRLSAGREADDADSRGVEGPFLASTANQSHCPLRILKRSPPVRLAGSGKLASAIAEDKRGNSLTVEPVSNLGALLVDDDVRIASARENQNRRSRRSVGQVDIKCG